jgi:hypothetical protein
VIPQPRSPTIGIPAYYCESIRRENPGIHQGNDHEGVCDVLYDFWTLRTAMSRLVRIAKREKDKTLAILTGQGRPWPA